MDLQVGPRVLDPKCRSWLGKMAGRGSGRTVWEILSQNLPKVWGKHFMENPWRLGFDLPTVEELVDSARAGISENLLKRVTFQELLIEVRCFLNQFGLRILGHAFHEEWYRSAWTDSNCWTSRSTRACSTPFLGHFP